MTIQRKKGHGQAKHGKMTPTYMSWTAMKARCLNPRRKSYKDYGGRGIQVCAEWMDFRNFLRDMGERPPGRSIDRINVAGNYQPSNCRWATIEEQANNRRNVLTWYQKNAAALLYQMGVSRSALAIAHGISESSLTRAVFYKLGIVPGRRPNSIPSKRQGKRRCTGCNFFGINVSTCDKCGKDRRMKTAT